VGHGYFESGFGAQRSLVDNNGLMIPTRFNAATYFVDRNIEEGRADSVAICCGDQALTYAQVVARVNQTGHALRRLGVEVENRVLMVVPDCPEFVYSFMGAVKIGAVPVPVNTLLTPADYSYMLADTRAKVLVIGEQLLGQVRAVIESAPYVTHVLVVGDSLDALQNADRNARKFEIHDFSRLIVQESTQLSAADTSRDDVAFWLYTSGTTGSPSAAVHLHHDMVVCSESYARGILNLAPTDRIFSVAKLFFAYGLGNSLYFPFSSGAATILYPGRPQPKAVFELVARQRPTILCGVPTSYAAMLHEAEQGASVDMSSLRVAISAGEPLPASLYHRWRDRFGTEILDGIGTTEALHIFISNRQGQVRPGSSGKPVPGFEVKLLDDDGQPTPAGKIGNLLVSGDSISSGYWKRHDATIQAFQGNWFRTRDKYHVDEDGYYWYDGRADDMLKVGGLWISPAELEQAMVEHPAVLECAVVGLVNDAGLTQPKAFVVAKDPAQAGDDLAAELQSFVKTRLAPYKYPRVVEFIDELPKTATGKIQRYKLRRPAEAT